MDAEKFIEEIKTRKAFFGAKTALKQKSKGNVDTAYVASDCPLDTFERVQAAFGNSLIKLDTTSHDLRATCKKPFTIFVISIMKGKEEKSKKTDEEKTKEAKTKVKKERKTKSKIKKDKVNGGIGNPQGSDKEKTE